MYLKILLSSKRHLIAQSYAFFYKKPSPKAPYPQVLHILQQFLQILKVAGKRRQTKTRFQSAKRERLRRTKMQSRG